jgi:hypothetical protein
VFDRDAISLVQNLPPAIPRRGLCCQHPQA